jgi:hypothetical protein
MAAAFTGRECACTVTLAVLLLPVSCPYSSMIICALLTLLTACCAGLQCLLVLLLRLLVLLLLPWLLFLPCVLLV